jgi:hypothetical protein
MSIRRRSRWSRGAAFTGTIVFLAWALSGCGGSSLRTPSADADLDGPGGAPIDREPGTGGTGAAGGAIATGGTLSLVDGGGPGGQGSGGVTATGGTAGTGGLIVKGGTAGPADGGVTATGGATGTGGQGGKGGTTGTGGGGATATGGSAGTGGLAGKGGTAGSRAGGAGGDGGAGGAGGGTGPAMFQPLVNAFCTAAKSCCAREGYPKADLNDCESKFLSRLESFPLVGKGTVTVDQNALAACVAAYGAAATACTITSVYAACKGVFVGTQTEGQPCGGASKFGAVECKPVNGSAACHWEHGTSDPTTTGTCVDIPRGRSGDECSMTCLKEDTCIVDMIGGSAPFPVACFEEDGLYCSVAANPPVCKPIVRLGDACTWDIDPCGSDNYCGWTANTCQPASKLGESCADSACAKGLVCETSGKCVEQPFASETTCKGAPSTP